ncbi:MAG TPA: YhgE/Pip domain-containing protein [Pseudogracilibacillus sp.]|nr:YhgE/Pip domain-containing protein [Pseudogracilibacillus sp.]
MKNIFKIYTKDLKSIVTNVMTAVLVGGLIFLPSLYAWLNITASWDPYAKTEQIPIGFVNEDEGAVIRDQEVHVGDELEEHLKENDNFKWNFVDRKEGMQEIEYGNFYAMIVVPKDFSETLGSIVTDEPKKADMEYYVNEKINAIAPKITDKGASVIVEEISSQFISTVNGIIFEMFNDIGLELEESLPDIEQFEEYVFTLEEELPTIYDKLVDMDDQLTKANKLLQTANEQIPTVKSVTNEGLEATSKTLNFLNEVEKEIKNISPTLHQEVDELEATFSDVNKKQEEVKETIEQEMKDIDIAGLQEDIPTMKKNLAEMEKSLKEVQDSLKEPREEIDTLIEELQTLQTELTKIEDKTADVDKFIADNEQFLKDLESSVQDVTDIDLQAFVKEYDENIAPKMLAEISNGKDTVQQAQAMLESISGTIPDIENTIGSTETKIKEGQDALDEMFKQYPIVQDRVNELADKIRSIQSEADLQEIIDLLLNDPEAEKGFFAEPVLLTKHEVFPIDNYGTGMTPFYTVLSLWVGGLLLISLLSPNVPGQETMDPKVVYMGRLLTFVTIGICQSLIVTMGDIFILGVSMSSAFWFVIFGLLTSLVFMSVAYTAIAILGDVGKAVVIILLVLQIASSGGTYPVVLLPEFFQAIHPFLPFTYAVDLMREAVGGIIWAKAWKDIGFLVGFAILTITVGILLKGPVQIRMQKVMKSKGGRLFH